MAHNSINPELAAKKMIERGVRPLERYQNSNARWKCECLTCGDIVFPRYGSVVVAGKGGCDSCAKRQAGITRNQRIREIDFPAACKAANVTPLSEFVDAFAKIELQCNTCGHKFPRAWSPLRDGRGCPKCTQKANSQRKLETSEPVATQLLMDAGVRPIGPYKGMSKPYPGLCLTCGSAVKPRPSGLQQGQGGCFKCGKAEGGRKRRDATYSRDEALEIMALRDIAISPEEPYPGASKPWPGKCARCGLPVATNVTMAKSGKGGCRVCHSLESDSSFDYFGPGVLYLIESTSFQAFKIGIAEKTSNRLSSHRQAGWDKVLFTHDALGYEVNYVEQFVLNWLREEMRVPEAVSNDLLPEKGGTETWPHGTVAPELVWAKAIEQFDAKNWPIPRAISEGTATKKARRGCSVIEDGVPCPNVYSSKGFCRKHHSRWRQYGDPLYLKRVPFKNDKCAVVDGGKVCGKKARRSAMGSDVGMCKTHYWRNFEYGDPTFMKRPTPKERSGQCSKEGCGAEDYSLGLCKTHYHEKRRVEKRAREGLPEPVKYESDLCSIDGCERERNSLGLCHLHYTRQKNYGSPHKAGRGPRQMTKIGQCRVPECVEEDAQKGLCLAHYHREYKRKRRGSPSLLD